MSEMTLSDIRDLIRMEHRQHLLPLDEARPGRLPPGTVTWVGDAQQGGGGKGAMVDRLAATHDIVVRVQGGDNAGHTATYSATDGSYTVLKMHLVPSGMRRPGTVGVLSNGVLVNPDILADDIADLAQVAPDAGDRLYVSDRAHIIFPYQRQADELQESRRRRSGGPLETTGRGVGPANLSRSTGVASESATFTT